MFLQSSAVPTKISEIHILPLLKNHVQNEHWNKNFPHILAILTGFYMFSCVILWVTRFFYKKLGFLSWESQNGQKVKKLAKKSETLFFYGTKNFVLSTMCLWYQFSSIYFRLLIRSPYKIKIISTKTFL